MSNDISLEELQYKAFSELVGIVNSCNTYEALMEQVSDWKDKYNIIDISTFFVDEDLYIKAKNLLISALEKLKKEQEEALNNLNMVAQKRTFFRLYNICNDAKNYKDFEVSKEKLDFWLKDHPKDSWKQFSQNYQDYFEKFANEKYLSFITGHAKQETAISSLEEIVDYSIRYSNYLFFAEHLNIWERDYSSLDFLSRENQDKVESLKRTGYEKITPPDIYSQNLYDFSSSRSAIIYASLATTINSSKDKNRSIVDWINNNFNYLSLLEEKDLNKIKELIMEKCGIATVPQHVDFSIGDAKESHDVKNVNNTAISYFLYKINSNNLSANDRALFEVVAFKSDLLKGPNVPTVNSVYTPDVANSEKPKNPDSFKPNVNNSEEPKNPNSSNPNVNNSEKSENPDSSEPNVNNSEKPKNPDSSNPNVNNNKKSENPNSSEPNGRSFRNCVKLFFKKPPRPGISDTSGWSSGSGGATNDYVVIDANFTNNGISRTREGKSSIDDSPTGNGVRENNNTD